MKTIGETWKDNIASAKLPKFDAPIISTNIAKHQPASSSWSDDMWIMDFGNDDDFQTSWLSNKTVTKPWYEIDFDKTQSFNMVTIADPQQTIKKYRIEYKANAEWKTILSGEGDQNQDSPVRSYLGQEGQDCK